MTMSLEAHKVSPKYWKTKKKSLEFIQQVAV